MAVLGPDIVLIGAGRSPHTRNLRRRNGFPHRNRWIGTIQMRAHLRVGVDREFVQKHYEQIVEAVRDGVLLVEYKLDRFVDAEELKTLAFGSEEERQAYEQEATNQLEQKTAEYQQLAEQRRLEEYERSARSVLGRMPVAKPDADRIPVGMAGGDLTGGGTEDLRFATDDPSHDINTVERYGGEKDGIGAFSAPLNTLEGSREEHIQSPRELAAELAAETTEASARGELVPDQPEAEARAIQEAPPPPTEEEAAKMDVGTTPNVEPTPDDVTDAEPEYHPDEDPDASNDQPPPEGEPIPEGEFKPLPEGWKSATKAELLAYCEERGIDTSDTPSNKELRRRLEGYQARGA